PLDILKFDGFRAQKREILRPRWIPTLCNRAPGVGRTAVGAAVGSRPAAPDASIARAPNQVAINDGRNDLPSRRSQLVRDRVYSKRSPIASTPWKRRRSARITTSSH